MLRMGRQKIFCGHQIENVVKFGEGAIWTQGGYAK